MSCTIVCIFLMCTMIILVLDGYTICGFVAYDGGDYSGICQQGMGMCFMVDALQDGYLDIMQHHLFSMPVVCIRP